MSAEYKDYGYWIVPYFQHKASAIGPNTHVLIDAAIQRYSYPLQPFRSCFGVLCYAEKYLLQALENCCKDAVLAGKYNYSYICNTVSSYYKEPLKSPVIQNKQKEVSADIAGTHKNDDSKYSLQNLIKRQEMEAEYEE